MVDENDEGIALPLLWLDVDDAEVWFVNQLVVQHQDDEFILTFGHVAPPMLLGTPDENRERAKQIPYVPVKAVSRLGLTPGRMEEFIKVMTQSLQNYRRGKGSPG